MLDCERSTVRFGECSQSQSECSQSKMSNEYSQYPRYTVFNSKTRTIREVTLIRPSASVVQERTALLTLPNSTALQTLAAWGISRALVCATACDSAGVCSPCSSPPLRVELNTTYPAPNTPGCVAARDFATVCDAGAADAAAAYYVLGLPLPAPFWAVVWAATALAVFAAFALAVLAVRTYLAHVSHAACMVWEAARSEPADAEAGGKLDGPDFLAAATPALALLEMLAIAHAIAYLRLDADTAALPGSWPAAAIGAWGSAAFPGLFLLAGFNLTLALKAREDRSTSGPAVLSLTPTGKFLKRTC